MLCTPVVATSLVACGVATGDDVELADPSAVPFGLLEPDRVPGALRPTGGTVVDIHLFDPDSSVLVPVTRQVSTGEIDAVVAELESGPTDMESLLGLRSALTDIAAVDDLAVEGSTASVDLNDSFTTLGGNDQIIAIAQLVFTVTEAPTIDQLVITVEGANVEIPRADGTLTSDALTRADYSSFTPP
jgi:spore germination protein GerM